MSKILVRIYGSMFFSSSWKQELIVTEYGVDLDVIKGFKRYRTHLPFDTIAQVNIVKGFYFADLEVMNMGGKDNLLVKALKKSEAENAKEMIEYKIQEVREQRVTGHQPAIASVPQYLIADELQKLANLKNQGVLNEEEFQTQKNRLLK